jgi:hypothetical protein
MMDKFWQRKYEEAAMSLPDQDQTIALIRRLKSILSQYPVNIQMAAIGALLSQTICRGTDSQDDALDVVQAYTEELVLSIDEHFMGIDGGKS